jgi:glycosyltransferase involved in cell wall biosynthesis
MRTRIVDRPLHLMRPSIPDPHQADADPRVKIGYYLFAPRLGGAEAYARDLIKGLDTSKFSPTVFLPPWGGLRRFLEVDSNPSARVRVVDTREPSVTFSAGAAPGSGFGEEAPPSAMRRLAKRVRLPRAVQQVGLDALRYASLPRNRQTLEAALKETEVDLLHVINGGYPGAVSALAAVVAGHDRARRVVFTVCSTAMSRTLLSPLERRIDQLVVGAVDAAIVPGGRPADALTSRGFSRQQIRTIPWGVRAPFPVDRAIARQQLGVSPDALLVACIANFTPSKGQPLVVEAMAMLRSRYPMLRAVLAGDGPQRAEVATLVRRLGVADVVDLPGVLGEPWGLLAAADVFVLASDIEGLPLSVLEALSQGLPVVATDVGGMPDAVVPGVTGLLIPPGRSDKVAAALTEILDDPVSRGQMGSAARVRYEERFTMESMIRSHESLYEELLSGG